MEEYKSELKQALMPNMYENGLLEIMQNMWTILKNRHENPFLNTGNRVKLPHFDIQAYSWTDENQQYNLKWKNWKVSWYKHCNRGVNVNRHLTMNEIEDCLKQYLLELSEEKNEKSNI